ncbi:LysR family transcriptional regulator [Acidiferrimicrobium sp. IK]|uniref:LysR substrate-binding domain-containing protein n=1 Tax=Acidiferrimicrobium sp. IK TaxID=2871700 RepID=UPI0021CB3CA2|nr:LysR substrate-binding domain-containing protein [Acidiferrimicrobium sp. IK]MCU4185456.1 LysR family transcriptional regulator [Acidiferrimicrobium sp. IK]
MELAQLENFVVLADHLHFRRAASLTGVSASTLSRQIGDLERDLGFRLFERNRRQVSLTPAGEVFLAETRAVLHRLRFAVIDAGRIARGEQARLRIGHGDAVGLALLQATLPRLREKYPDMRLVVVEAPTAELLDGVIARSVDVALVRPPVHGDGLEHQALCEEELVVALPAGHGLCEQARVAVQDLAGEALVVPPRSASPGAFDVIMGIFAAARVQANVVEEATTDASVLLLVGAGLGVAVTPVFSTRHYEPGGVEVRPLARPARLPLHMAWRSEDRSSALPVLRGLLEAAVAERAVEGTGMFLPPEEADVAEG